MRTREPILTRGRDHWDTINLPVGEFERRLGEVREAMAADGLDALLLYGTGDRDGDIAYVSNLVHKVPGFPLALAVTAETAVAINQRSSRTRPIVERSTWIDDVRFTRDLWSTFDDVLAEEAREGAVVGVIGTDSMAVPEHEALESLRSEWSIQVRDGYLDDLRRTKSPRERDQLRRAGRIVRAVAEAVPSVARPTIRERRVEAALDRLARLEGAQDVRVLLSNPGRTEDELRPPEGGVALGRDPVSVYLAVRFEGYWAAAARTSEDPGETTADLDALVAAIQPGRDAAAVLDAAAGRGLDIATGYPVVSGIGLELDEPPTVGAGSSGPFEFEPGIALEVTLAERAAGGPLVVSGDTVLVTTDGPEIVSR